MPQRHSERQNPKSPYKRATSIAIPDLGPGMLHSVWWRWRHASLQLTYSGGNNKVRRSKTFYFIDGQHYYVVTEETLSFVLGCFLMGDLPSPSSPAFN